MTEPLKLVRDYRQCPPEAQGAAVAIGNFDGLHPGHMRVLEALRHVARNYGVPSAVLTFEPHPRRFFSADSPRLRLISPLEKLRLLHERDIGIVYALRFNAALAHLSAEAFVRDVLVGALRVRAVVVGEDFVFGYRRQGDVALLRALGEELGFQVYVVPLLHEGGKVFSSSAVRARLADGDPAGAAKLLGRPFAVDGHVLHGDARGREMGFPTLNLSLRDRYLPKFGVYAVRVHVEGHEVRPLEGVANLGVRPTFGGETPTLETYLFDFQGTLYGARVRVELLTFLRAERRFPDAASLAA